MPKLTALFCTAVLLVGQNPPKPEAQDGEHVIRETFKFVLVPVTVTDPAGTSSAD